MNWIKIIAINFLILFAFLGIILISPPLIYHLYKFYMGSDFISYSDERSNLEIYDRYEWAAQNFREASQLNTKYHDYITWRRDDYAGETINIQNGVRKTKNVVNKTKSNKEFWFFGGSTMWGTGVSDDFTLPSLFAINSKNYSENFGELGYISRQSYAFLTNYIISNNYNDLHNVNVVFYDGVNDVAQRCRFDASEMGTNQEDVIRRSVAAPGARRLSFSRTFSQPMELLQILISKLQTATETDSFNEEWHQCDKDPSRALEVAETLIDTWQVTSDIVKNRGGNFFAILQPVSYYGNADVSYLNLDSLKDKSLARQYNAVYPLIVELAATRDINFINLTDIYDYCSNCYIDFNHVGPQGNLIAAKKFISALD